MGKKAPMLWKSMSTNFPGSPIRWVVLLYFPVLRKIERKTHAFSIWWDLLIISCVSKSKLNSIENIISAELIDSDINHNEFTLVINKVYKYFRLNKNIRTKDDQLGDTERDKFLKRRAERIGKKKKRERERQSLKLKRRYKIYWNCKSIF